MATTVRISPDGEVLITFGDPNAGVVFATPLDEEDDLLDDDIDLVDENFDDADEE
jgi:hypothetical protein